MPVEQACNIASVAIAGISTLVAFIKVVQAKKSSGKANATAEENNKLRKVNTLAKIIQKIPELISKAEKLFPSNGEIKFGPQKLEYVLKELQILCMEQDIEYQETEFTYEIEKILETPQKGEKSNANESSES